MIYTISKYNIPNTESSSFRDLKQWLKHRAWVVIDSETTSPDDFNDVELIMFQIGDGTNQWIIDCRDYSLAQIKKELEDQQLLKIGHNIKYDYKVLKLTENIILNNVWDTMQVEYILPKTEEEYKGYYSLEQTHLRYAKFNPYGNQLSLFDPYIPKSQRNLISKKARDEQITWPDAFYGATDIITASTVYQSQIVEVALEDSEEVVNLENKFTLVLGDIEINGMPLNQSRWLELADWSGNKLIETEERLKRLHPEIENWNSSKQVAGLFKTIGIPISIADKTTAGKVKDSVQEIVIKEHEDEFPIIKDYLRYKGFQKLYSTYGVKFLDYVSPTTGRIHSSFHQILNTGRTSSTSPNLQNVVSEKSDFPEGKWWREAFSTSEGRTFVICDYGSQELHIVAHKSQDPAMLEVLRNKGDLHRAAAAALYEKSPEDITSAERKEGKITNFTIVYGGGEAKISETFKIPRIRARKIIANYFKTFTKVKEFQEKSFAYALNTGHILIDQLGRKFYIKDYNRLLWLKNQAEDPNCSPDIRREYSRLASKVFRDASNYPIQGTAASMSKFAGILMREEELKAPGLFKILLLIHDEWVVECALEDSEKVKTIVEACMSKAAHAFCKSVAIPADALITSKWNK